MIDYLGTIFFAFAILHTFLVGFFHSQAKKYDEASVIRKGFLFLGEIEIVFGLWATLFFIGYIIISGWSAAVAFIESVHFTEPSFVFAILIISSTKPVLDAARELIQLCSASLQKIIPVQPQLMDVFILLIVGPLSGSFITEPAAITVTALLLKDLVHKNSERFAYFLLAVLFVNVSIGGALTPFAAPPILMVAKAWNWDLKFTLIHFGWKSAAAVFMNSVLFTWFFRREIRSGVFSLKELAQKQVSSKVPKLVVLVHFIFLLLVILTSHYINLFMALLLLFLGFATLTESYQYRLRIKESLLVAFFLAGIIVFGPFQSWWLQPILQSLSEGALFWSATLLTAVTDNAALTYLGAQVSGLSQASQYALVAGAISGGGLTVIANAPNAAGYSILISKFPGGSMKSGKLFLAALIPTLIACFFLFLTSAFQVLHLYFSNW